MLIAGAGGHAKEIVTELYWLAYTKPLFFFDNTPGAADTVLGMQVLHHEAAVKKTLAVNNRFIIGVGNPAVREALYQLLTGWGAIPDSLVSAHARVGLYDMVLGEGLNIMAGAVITASVKIGKGTLVNVQVSIHHDCSIGEFCELSPGCKILGKVTIGNYTSVGSNAVVLPGITVGSNVSIGAGAVVTKNVPDKAVVKGIPGRW